MTDRELLISLHTEVQSTMLAAVPFLEHLGDLQEGATALAAVQRMLAFHVAAGRSDRENVIAGIAETRNALIPARYHLSKLTMPPAVRARALIQQLLDFVTECDNEVMRTW